MKIRPEKYVRNVQIHLAQKLLFEPRIQKFHKDSKEARHQCNTSKSTEKEPDPNYKQIRIQNETKTSLLVDYRNCDDCTNCNLNCDLWDSILRYL